MIPRIEAWLTARGISPSVLALRRLSWDGSRIVIPVTRPDGTEFAKKRRDPDATSGEKYLCDTGGTRTLYGWPEARGSDEIWICEGELDSLRLVSAGLSAVSSTAGAGSWDHAWSSLFSGKTAVVWYDSDEAGRSGASATCYSLAPYALKTVLVRHDQSLGKDLTDFLLATGLSPSLASLRSCGRATVTEFHRPLSSPRIRFPTAIATGTAKPPLSDVLARYGAEPRKPVCVIRCVLHEDTRPSMSVNCNSGLWHCFSCDEGGDSWSLIMRKEGCTFPEAKKLMNFT